MEVLQSFKGTGVLLVLDERFDHAEYEFEVRRVNDRLESSGTITMRSGDALTKAFNAGTVILQLASGETVDAILVQKHPYDGERTASIVISGPIPNFNG